MTSKAREVLDDCRVALEMLEAEQDLRKWRVHWAAAVALTRSVGYVLHKVDGRDPRIKHLANEAYSIWNSDAPEHEIFREFIDKERNNILKQYEFNIHPLEKVDVAIRSQLQPLKGGPPIESYGVFPISENIYRPVLNGYREGDDARDVLSDALTWWNNQLAAIEAAVIKGKN